MQTQGRGIYRLLVVLIVDSLIWLMTSQVHTLGHCMQHKVYLSAKQLLRLVQQFSELIYIGGIAAISGKFSAAASSLTVPN